jgi:hypothetical protein
MSKDLHETGFERQRKLLQISCLFETFFLNSKLIENGEQKVEYSSLTIQPGANVKNYLSVICDFLPG